jgi:hypothetical protein
MATYGSGRSPSPYRFEFGSSVASNRCLWRPILREKLRSRGNHRNSGPSKGICRPKRRSAGKLHNYLRFDLGLMAWLGPLSTSKVSYTLPSRSQRRMPNQVPIGLASRQIGSRILEFKYLLYRHPKSWITGNHWKIEIMSRINNFDVNIGILLYLN